MEPIELIRIVNYAIALVFLGCYAYQLLYILVPFVRRDKPHQPTKRHRYAVLISARNESAVIGHLLESIRRQDYPAELVTTFVVADNCTDDTAEASRLGGAVVYERFNQLQVGKGYALNFLLQHIRADYGADAFDGFFVYDADNLLEPNYITEMNKTFSDGYRILTSYRNSKNYGDNWISAGYALWFLREAEYLNHARMLLGTSCAVSGTGFLFHRDVLTRSNGWNFFLLTEDIEFTVNSIISGEKIGYCPTAMLYDEQPTTFRQSWRQRMRWARGYLQVFRRYGGALIRGIFRRHGGFACFDMAMSTMPAIALTVISLIANGVAAFIGLQHGQEIIVVLQSAGEALLNSYLFLLAIGGLTTITQWKNIHTSAVRKVLYTFTFPLFMMTYIPISFAALFRKVNWTPIEHKVSISIRDLDRTHGT